MIKLKTTYTNSSGIIEEIIIPSLGFHNFYIEILNIGIGTETVIKVEKIFEASPENTKDLTKE